MNIIAHDANSARKDSPTSILHHLDLAEWEIEYHWSQFEELTLEAQRHLALHDEAQLRRKEAINAVNASGSLLGAECGV